MPKAEWDRVVDVAVGDRDDYRMDAVPLAPRGGQGEVFRAEHKSTGIEVALKRLIEATPDAIARMKREIDVAAVLAGNPRVMPILDAGAEATWFVMPLAQRSAADRQEQLGSDDDKLRRLVRGVCKGLAAAHGLGWVHRDIKPENILSLEKKWVVADWGLGRRPRGQTTVEGRTQIGQFLGTDRFAAPELADDAHEATQTCDIYSVGQVIGWAVTGRTPMPFTALIPDSGPWRGVVRAATHSDPGRRPQTIADLLELIEEEFDEPSELPLTTAEDLLERVLAGKTRAAERLWSLAAREAGDYDIYVNVLSKLPAEVVQEAVRRDRFAAQEVVTAFRDHLDDSGHRNLGFRSANGCVKVLLAVATEAGRLSDWILLEDAAEVMFEWDSRWDQWNARDGIVAWVRTLDGEAARSVARALRRNPESVDHLSSLATDSRVDGRIRTALTR